MCTPPYCEPARHVFGCLSLRDGASIVLVLNIFYGVCLVALHSILLGEEKSEALAESRRLRDDIGAVSRLLTAYESLTWDTWHLELADLEHAWAHKLLGAPDSTCLFAGLVYGVAVILGSMGMLYLVTTAHAQTAKFSQWFMAILHIEIILFVMVAVAKFPRLCNTQEEFWPHLSMDCDVLRYTFAERTLVLVAFASLCTWIFSSFAFFVGGGSGSATQAAPQHAFGGHNHPTTSNKVSLRQAAHYFPRQSSSHVSSMSGRYYH